MSAFFFDDQDSMSNGFSKGLLTGALGLAGVYGLNELKNYIMDKFNITPSVYPKDTILKFNIKKSELVKQAVNPFAAYTYGLGLPIGAFGSYKLLQYLSNKLHQYDIQGDVRRYDKAVEYSVKRDMEDRDTPKETRAAYHAALKEELMNDPEVDKYLNDNFFSKKAEDGVSSTPSMGDVVSFLGVTMPTSYLPILYGALAPIGLGIGYYGTERLMRDKNTFEDPGKPPRLVYRIDNNGTDDPIPDNEVLKKTSGILDDMLSGASNVLPGGKQILDTIRGGKKTYDKITSMVGEAEKNIPTIKSFLSGIESLQSDPLKFLTSNPKLLAGGMGLATAASIPSMAFNYLSNKNLGSKLDNLISKLDTKTSIADNFKLSNTNGIRS